LCSRLQPQLSVLVSMKLLATTTTTESSSVPTDHLGDGQNAQRLCQRALKSLNLLLIRVLARMTDGAAYAQKREVVRRIGRPKLACMIFAMQW